MSLNVNNLTSLFEANSTQLMMKGLKGSRTVQLADTVGGIKNSQHMFSIESTAFNVTDADCSVLTSGTTTLLKVPVSINRLGVKESICQGTLEDYFNSWAFKAGQNTRDESSLGAFAAQYTAEKLQSLSYTIDQMIWQGNTSTGSGNLSRIDGVLAALYSQSASTQNIASSALSESNAIQVVKDYFDALPDSAKSKNTITMFMGYDEFAYVQSALAGAGFNFTNHENPFIDGLTFPYRRLRIEAVHGLDGTGRKPVFAMPEQIKIGTDLSSELEGQPVRMWYSQDDDIHYFQAKFALGVNVGIPSYIVNDIL